MLIIIIIIIIIRRKKRIFVRRKESSSEEFIFQTKGPLPARHAVDDTKSRSKNVAKDFINLVQRICWVPLMIKDVIAFLIIAK